MNTHILNSWFMFLATRKFHKNLLIFNLLLLSALLTKGQQANSYFSALSSDTYKDRITYLEKFKPAKRFDDKTSQSLYEEIISNRTKELLNNFKNNGIVKDTLLLNKLNFLHKKIVAANPGQGLDSIKVYLVRSPVCNAFNMGEGAVYVFLGLFLWAENDDELAMVLAHELAHEVLKHTEKKIEKHINTLTSEDVKAELKSIKRSDYGKFSRYRELVKDMSITGGKHSRQNEAGADALAAKWVKNAGFDIMNGANFILRLDSAENYFTASKIYNLKELLTPAGVNLSYFTTKTKYKGLSSVEVTMNADLAIDSIKTHPDCPQRFQALTGKPAKDQQVSNCISLTESLRPFKERAMIEIVRVLYGTENISLCIHLSLLALKNNYDPVFYNYMLSKCFSDIYYFDKHIKRFSAVNAEARRGSNLKELQDYLFAASTDDIEKLAVYFLNAGGEKNSEEYAFASLMYETRVKMKEPKELYDAFNQKFPNSKYYYLIKPKKEEK